MKKISRQQAIALGYDEKEIAPRILGKGRGFVAEEIIKKAKEHNIPIQEDETLVELLSQLEINETIPEELYEVVAEIFAFVYRLDKNSKS